MDLDKHLKSRVRKQRKREKGGGVIPKCTKQDFTIANILSAGCGEVEYSTVWWSLQNYYYYKDFGTAKKT